MDFLVLHKVNEGTDDWEVAATILGLGKDDGERAIEQGMIAGEGEYMAVPLDKAVRRSAVASVTLAEPTEPEAG